MVIKTIQAFKTLSSLGHFTISVEITFENGIVSTAGIPFGLSAGKYEAQNVPADEGVAQIEAAKNTLLSGNASIALSVAFWKATEVLGQKIKYSTFPKLCMLLFEGGKHGSAKITFQEFMLVEQSLEQGILDYHKMHDYLAKLGVETTVG